MTRTAEHQPSIGNIMLQLNASTSHTSTCCGALLSQSAPEVAVSTLLLRKVQQRAGVCTRQHKRLHKAQAAGAS
jgi:hypothetical protein